MNVFSRKDPQCQEEQSLVQAVRGAVDSIEANLKRSLESLDRLEAKLEAFLR